MNPLNIIDDIVTNLQDLTLAIKALQEHVDNLEAENEDLAYQIIDLEQENSHLLQEVERAHGEYQ